MNFNFLIFIRFIQLIIFLFAILILFINFIIPHLKFRHLFIYSKQLIYLQQLILNFKVHFKIHFQTFYQIIF